MSFLQSIGLKKSSKFSPGRTSPDKNSRSNSPLMKTTKPSPPSLIDDNQSSFQSTKKEGARIDISTANSLISDLPTTPITPDIIDLPNSLFNMCQKLKSHTQIFTPYDCSPKGHPPQKPSYPTKQGV